MGAILVAACLLAALAAAPWSDSAAGTEGLLLLAVAAPAFGAWAVDRCGERPGRLLAATALAAGLWSGAIVVLASDGAPAGLALFPPLFGLVALGTTWRVARPRGTRDGALLLGVAALAAALPLGFGLDELTWARAAPGAASVLLDFSPWTFVMESAGVDWMRDERVYDAAGTEWFSDTRRPYPFLTGGSEAWKTAGLKSLAAPTLVVLGCSAPFLVARRRARAIARND